MTTQFPESTGPFDSVSDDTVGRYLQHMYGESEECIHEGMECEHNTGPDACPCRCSDCTEWEDDSDYETV